MPLLELDDHPLPSDGEFDLLDVAVEGCSAEEGDVDTRLTGELALVCVVVRWVWFEHDVASSNEIELGVVAGDVKTAGALGPGGAGVADDGTKGGGQGLEQLGSGVKGADGLPKLGTNMACHERFADLDFDVEYLARQEKLLALLGNSETVFAGEGVRLDADPDDGGGGGLSDETDASNVRARLLHPLGLENVVDPKS